MNITVKNGNKEIDIFCQYGDCRDGFNHFCQLEASEDKISVRYKAHYINHTWEVYRFQTVIHQALLGYVEQLTGEHNLFSLYSFERKTCKGAEAEARRQAKAEARANARALYNDLTRQTDGSYFHERRAA